MGAVYGLFIIEERTPALPYPFVTFIVFNVAWALIGYAVLSADIAHPIAVSAAWLLGYVWFVGRIFGGQKEADALLIYYAAFLAISGLVATLVYLVP